MTGASVAIQAEQRVAWWRPLVQWAMCIPHLVYNLVLQAAALVVWLITAICVIVTGRIPARLAEFQIFALRERVRTYSYLFVLRTSYPPFATEISSLEPGDDPAVHVDAIGPINVPRWTPIMRPLVILPSLIVLVPIGALLDLLYPVLMLAVGFNEGWPSAFARFLVRVEEWTGEVLLYLFMATDHAPRLGFSTDPAAEHRAIVIGAGTAGTTGRSAQPVPASASASVTKSISRSTAPTSAG